MLSQSTLSVAERVAGCLQGVATGDALGKQTELLSHAEVLRWYPNGIKGFERTPGSIIPRYVGNRKREWRVGETTDVGIVFRPARLDDLVDGAREASIPTHGGSIALAAAAANAAAVSAAIDAWSAGEIITFAESAAAEAKRRWPETRSVLGARCPATVNQTPSRGSTDTNC